MNSENNESFKIPVGTQWLPFTDLETRKTILQIFDDGGNISNKNIRESLEKILEKYCKKKDENKKDYEQVLEIIEEKNILTANDSLKYSKEYLGAKRLSEEDRKKNYKEIQVKTIERKTPKDPYKVLGVSESDSYEKIKSTFRYIIKLIHDDKKSLARLTHDYDKLPKEIKDVFIKLQLLNSSDFQFKTMEEIEELSVKEKEEYEEKAKKCLQKEKEMEDIKNKQFQKLSDYQIDVLEAWETISKKCGKKPSMADIQDLWKQKEEKLGNRPFFSQHNIELTTQEAKLRKNTKFLDEALDPTLYLDFDWNALSPSVTGRYLEQYCFHQTQPLKLFMAWLDHVQGKEIKSILLTDFATKHNLNPSKLEQLRQMLMNKEPAHVISEVLQIEEKVISQTLSLFFEGAKYKIDNSHWRDEIYEYEYRNMGISIHQDGSIELQIWTEGFFEGDNKTIILTPKDIETINIVLQQNALNESLQKYLS